MASSVEIGGFLFPARDDRTANVILRESKNIPLMSAFAEDNRVCVQAGANVGVYPQSLASHFEHVYTFEPQPFLFSLLEQNLKAKNVTYFHAALGDQEGRCGVKVDKTNWGASHLIEGDEAPIMTIDSLDLQECDLIWLDIEGYEFKAIQGAMETIQRHKPIVAFEDKGLGLLHGIEDQAVQKLLRLLGYKQVGRIKRDTVLAT